MPSKPGQNRRVVSGMRPTGQLHLGNYHGALANWVELQYRYECFFFVADWHALTTAYEDTSDIQSNTNEVLIDWLAAGLNPSACTIFVQSRVPEHAELHLILSMVTPVSWLERVPTYKDQIAQLKDKDLSTYGFLGYPLLQSADILMYRPEFVPVGEDQVAHVEITREVARRFNNIFGREADFETKVAGAVKRLGVRHAAQFEALRRRFQEQGDGEALTQARAMIEWLWPWMLLLAPLPWLVQRLLPTATSQQPALRAPFFSEWRQLSDTQPGQARRASAKQRTRRERCSVGRRHAWGASASSASSSASTRSA